MVCVLILIAIINNLIDGLCDFDGNNKGTRRWKTPSMVDNFGVTGSEKSFNIVNHLSEYFPAAVNIVVGCPAGCPAAHCSHPRALE